jgi:serine/threonine-protein kinase OSR1/STK39
MHGTPNGLLLNGHVRKHNAMESCDLDLQEKDFDAIPTSSFHERKFSLSSCSSDGFLSSKERFVVRYNLKNKI